MRTSQKMVLARARRGFALLGGLSIQAIVTLVLCIGFGIAGIYFATTINGEIPLSNSGVAALIIGVVFSLIVGVGLMALIFFSSRAGFDEAAVVEREDKTQEPDDSRRP